jgi:hypothetical protein
MFWKCEVGLSSLLNQQFTWKWYFIFMDEKLWFQGDCAWETGKAGKHNWAGM